MVVVWCLMCVLLLFVACWLMVGFVCCGLFDCCCLLVVGSLFVVRCWLLVVRCAAFVGWCALCVACCVLRYVCSLLCRLLVVCRVVLVVVDC